MFGRSESEQIRALLRVIESQQRTIAEQNDRLMYLTGNAWTLPNLPENTQPVADYVPQTWTPNPEQEPVF